MSIKIHNIGNYMINNYILETEQGLIILDTGYPSRCTGFINKFKKKFNLYDVKYIFITHHHDDHVGFLAELLEYVSAPVIIHRTALECLKKGGNNISEGAEYSSFPASIFGRFKKDFSFPPVNLPSNTIIIDNEDHQVFHEIGLPIKILTLYGHTLDSIGLLLYESKELFCGDAAMNAVISVARHIIWIDNVEKFQNSWDKMIKLAPSKIYPSHGTPFPVKNLVKYRHFMDNRKLIVV